MAGKRPRPLLFGPKPARAARFTPDGPKCIDPRCEEHRSKATAKQWTSCVSCEAGGPLCPAHVHEHFRTHTPRPVACHLVTIRKQRRPWGEP